MASNTWTAVGNLIADPDLKYTNSGVAYARCRIASTDKWTAKSGEAVEKTVFMDFTVWRDMAENVAESLRKGDRVIVYGRIEQREWTTDAGEKRSAYEVNVDAVGPDLRFAQASVSRTGSSGAGRPAPAPANDPFAAAAAAPADSPF